MLCYANHILLQRANEIFLHFSCNFRSQVQVLDWRREGALEHQTLGLSMESLFIRDYTGDMLVDSGANRNLVNDLDLIKDSDGDDMFC